MDTLTIQIIIGIIFFLMFCLGVYLKKKRLKKYKKCFERDSRTISHFSKGQNDSVNVISKTWKLLFCFCKGTQFQFVSEDTGDVFLHSIIFTCPIGEKSNVFLINHKICRTLDVIRGLSEKKDSLVLFVPEIESDFLKYQEFLYSTKER